MSKAGPFSSSIRFWIECYDADLVKYENWYFSHFNEACAAYEEMKKRDDIDFVGLYILDGHRQIDTYLIDEEED